TVKHGADHAEIDRWSVARRGRLFGPGLGGFFLKRGHLVSSSTGPAMSVRGQPAGECSETRRAAAVTTVVMLIRAPGARGSDGLGRQAVELVLERAPLGLHLLRRAVEDDLAVVDEQHAVGDRADFLEDVRRDEHRLRLP